MLKVKFISDTTHVFTQGKEYEMKDIGDCYAGFDDNGYQFYSWDMGKFGEWEIISE